MVKRSFCSADEFLSSGQARRFSDRLFNSGGRSRLKILISDYLNIGGGNLAVPSHSALSCHGDRIICFQRQPQPSAGAITIASKEGDSSKSYAQLPFLPSSPWFQFPQSQLPPRRCSEPVLPSHTTGAWSPPAAQASPEKQTLLLSLLPWKRFAERRHIHPQRGSPKRKFQDHPVCQQGSQCTGPQQHSPGRGWEQHQ